MMKEKELNTAIKEAQLEYQQKAHVLTASEISERTKNIKSLQAELCDLLSQGADPCENCEGKAIGMLRRPATIESGAVTSLPIYEVGCPVCKPIKKLDHVMSFSSWGNSPEQAVENWNNKLYIKK